MDLYEYVELLMDVVYVLIVNNLCKVLGIPKWDSFRISKIFLNWCKVPCPMVAHNRKLKHSVSEGIRMCTSKA